MRWIVAHRSESVEQSVVIDNDKNRKPPDTNRSFFCISESTAMFGDVGNTVEYCGYEPLIMQNTQGKVQSKKHSGCLSPARDHFDSTPPFNAATRHRP